MPRAPQSLPADQPLRARLHLAVVAIAALAGGGLLQVARSPARLERWCGDGTGGALARGLAAVSAPAPFALAEALIAAALLLAAVSVARAALDIGRGRRRLRNALARGALRAGSAAAPLGLVFYATFGLCYARAPLGDRLGWPALAEAPRERRQELERLAAELVDAANRAYLEAVGTADLGRPSEPPGRAMLDAALEAGMAEAAAHLGLGSAAERARGRAKPAFASPVMTRFGISGIHIPVTGEAIYNRDTPGCQRPHTIAHEKAHQRGIASEDEANFVGFLAAALAPDPYARYAGLLSASRQLLRDLAEADAAAADRLVARRLPGVERDVRAARAFWSAHEGPLAEVGEAVNDAYLRAHGVEEGVLSYSLASELIVRFARAQGGSAVPRASASASASAVGRSGGAGAGAAPGALTGARRTPRR